MIKPIDEMKSDYMTMEEITTKLRADGLEDYLEFKSNRDYDYLECESCDGPMLGHKVAECRYGQWYDERTRRKFKKWLDRIPELRRLLEIREATTGTSISDEINENRSRMDEWINQLQLNEERRSESRSGYSRTTSRERNRRGSSQFSRRSSSRSESRSGYSRTISRERNRRDSLQSSRRSSSRLTSRPDRIRNRSRDENPAEGAEERERSAEKPESDLGERVEGLMKEIEEIKKSIGGISRIEEILKKATIGAQHGREGIPIDVDDDMAERKVEKMDRVIRSATEAKGTAQYDDQDESLAPSPNKGTSTNCVINDKESRFEDWRNRPQSRGYRRSESRSGHSRTTSRGKDMRNSPETICTSEMDETLDSLTDDETIPETEKLETPIPRVEKRASRYFRTAVKQKQTHGLKLKARIKRRRRDVICLIHLYHTVWDAEEASGIIQPETRDKPLAISSTKGTSMNDATNEKRSRIDDWRGRLQSGGERRSESRPGYSATAPRGRDRRGSPKFGITQYDDQDESLAPSPTEGTSTNCDRGSRIDDWRSQPQSRGHRRSESRSGNSRTTLRGEETRNSSGTIHTSKMDETVDSLIDDEMILETEKCNDRSQIDEWRSRLQSRKYRRSENRPRYFRTARKRRQRHGLRLKARVKKRQMHGSSYFGEKQQRDTTEKTRAVETDKTVIDDETIPKTAKLEMSTPRGKPGASERLGERLEESGKRETTEKLWIREIWEENNETPKKGRTGKLIKREPDGKSRSQSRREKRSERRPRDSRTASRERYPHDSPQFGGGSSSRQILSRDQGGNRIESRSRDRSPANHAKERERENFLDTLKEGKNNPPDKTCRSGEKSHGKNEDPQRQTRQRKWKPNRHTTRIMKVSYNAKENAIVSQRSTIENKERKKKPTERKENRKEVLDEKRPRMLRQNTTIGGDETRKEKSELPINGGDDKRGRNVGAKEQAKGEPLRAQQDNPEETTRIAIKVPTTEKEGPTVSRDRKKREERDVRRKNRNADFAKERRVPPQRIKDYKREPPDYNHRQKESGRKR